MVNVYLMLLLRIFSFSDHRKLAPQSLLYNQSLHTTSLIQSEVFEAPNHFLHHKTAAERNTPPALKQFLLFLMYYRQMLIKNFLKDLQQQRFHSAYHSALFVLTELLLNWQEKQGTEIASLQGHLLPTCHGNLCDFN